MLSSGTRSFAVTVNASFYGSSHLVDQCDDASSSSQQTDVAVGSVSEGQGDEEGVEHELLVCGNRVVWSVAGGLEKAFTMSGPVLQACWANFLMRPEDEAVCSVLCVLHAHGLFLYCRGGRSFSVVLPCRMSYLWPLPEGLLLESQNAASTSSSTPPPPFPSSVDEEEQGRQATGGIPLLFSLFHPLDELRPVAWSPSSLHLNNSGSHETMDDDAGDGSDDDNSSGSAWDEAHVQQSDIRVVFSSASCPVVVAHHHRRQQLLFLCVRCRTDRSFSFQTGLSSQLFLDEIYAEQPITTATTTTTTTTTTAATLPRPRSLSTATATATASTFITYNHLNQQLLVIVDQATATASVYTISPHGALHVSVAKSHTIDDVLAMVPLSQAQRSPLRPVRSHVLLVQHCDLSTSLFAGETRLCHCNFIAPLAPPAAATFEGAGADEGTAYLAVVRFRHAVCNRVVLDCADGRSYRAVVPLELHDVLSRECVRLLSVTNVRLADMLLGTLFRSACATAEEEWDVLCSAIIGRQPEIDIVPDADVVLRDADRSESSGSAWDDLVCDDDHMRLCLELPSLSDTLTHSKTAVVPPSSHLDSFNNGRDGRGDIHSILRVLHVLYESFKIDVMLWPHLRRLSSFLAAMASMCDEVAFVDHYARDFSDNPRPMHVPSSTDIQQTQQHQPSLTPFHIYRHLMSFSAPNDTGGRFQQPVPRFDDPLRDVTCHNNLLPMPLVRMRQVCHFYEVLAAKSQSQPSPPPLGDPSTTSTFNPAPIEGVCSPKSDLLHRYPPIVRPSSSSSSSSSTPSSAPQMPPPTSSSPSHRVVLAMASARFSMHDLGCLAAGVSLPLLQAIDACRELPYGDLPPEACVLLGRTDLASSPDTVESNNIGSIDSGALPKVYAAASSPSLDQAAVGTAGVDPAGDGTSLIHPTSSFRFDSDLRLVEVRRLLSSSPSIRIKVKPKPGTSDHELVQLNQVALNAIAPRVMALPVARGVFTMGTETVLLTSPIRIPPLTLTGKAVGSNQPVPFDASVLSANALDWPEFHNGVAAGLRIASEQSDMSNAWLARDGPVEPNNEYAGVILALGLHGHLSSLAVTKVYDYLAASHQLTTIGVLIGMAATYRGTMDAAVAGLLSIHVPALHPPSSTGLEVAPAVQTAALMSIGLLYMGRPHRRMVEVLLSEIGRRPSDDRRFFREGHALSAGLALGMLTLGRGRQCVGLSDLSLQDSLHRYIQGGPLPKSGPLSRKEADHQQLLLQRDPSGVMEGSHLVMDGAVVNVDVTASGAILALGLMFLRTHDKSVAGVLAVPQTFFLLEHARPSHLMLRVACHALVMWNDTRCTSEWIENHVPAMVTQAIATDMTGAPQGDLDMDTLVQAEAAIRAGACFAIGVRYAGSGDVGARDVLSKYAMRFSDWQQKAKVDDNIHLIRSCMNAVALAVAMVMAGTGDLVSLRLLRLLRKRMYANNATYGAAMAINMAIGVLFLGGGRYTFGTSDVCVAALMTAFYPEFPDSSSDDRYHLQAFRHLYVLAAEPRCIEARDVDTRQPCYVPLRVHLNPASASSGPDPSSDDADGVKILELLAPCLLPDLSTISSIEVCSPQFWSRRLDMSSEQHRNIFTKATLKGVVYVKRKRRSGGGGGDGAADTAAGAEDYVTDGLRAPGEEASLSINATRDAATAWANEQSVGVMSTRLQLQTTLERLDDYDVACVALWSARLALKFIESRYDGGVNGMATACDDDSDGGKERQNDDNGRLVEEAFASRLHARMDSLFNEVVARDHSVRPYLNEYTAHRRLPPRPSASPLCGCLLDYFDIPSLKELCRLDVRTDGRFLSLSAPMMALTCPSLLGRLDSIRLLKNLHEQPLVM